MALLWHCISGNCLYSLRPCLSSVAILPSFVASPTCPILSRSTHKFLKYTSMSFHGLSNFEHDDMSRCSVKVRQAKLFDLRCVNQQWMRQKSDDTKYSSYTAVLSPKWMVDASPAPLKPYLQLIRLDRPVGTWLVYLPSTWSIAMATSPGQIPDIKLLGLFALGAFLMRGAGCTINDMWDKNYDAKVERTRERPLACGRLSNFSALVFLGGQLSCALAVLLSLNTYTILLGASCMVPVIVYPLMKRFTYWPHAILGVTLNWGILLGWSAVQGYCDWAAVLPLYLSGIMLTTIYDLIYAHQDKEDDITAGVKSAALILGDDSKKWLSVFAVAMVGGLSLSGFMCEQSLPFYAGVGLVAAHVAHQIYTVNLNDANDCGLKFRSNKYLGLFIFTAIAAGTYFKSATSETERGQKEICSS